MPRTKILIRDWDLANKDHEDQKPGRFQEKEQSLNHPKSIIQHKYTAIRFWHVIQFVGCHFAFSSFCPQRATSFAKDIVMNSLAFTFIAEASRETVFELKKLGNCHGFIQETNLR